MTRAPGIPNVVRVGDTSVIEQMQRLRTEGLSNREIGRQTGYTGQTVGNKIGPRPKRKAPCRVLIFGNRDAMESARLIARSLGYHNHNGPRPTDGSLGALIDAIGTGEVVVARPTMNEGTPWNDNDEALETIIDHLTTSHLETEGGYPYDYTWIGDTLVVSVVRDNETEIHTYQDSDLRAWYDRACKMAAEYPDEDFTFALYETEGGTRL